MFFGGFEQAIAIIAGLIVGLIIGIVTEIYTSGDYKSVKKIAEQSETGAATTIISGLAVGMMSTAIPILLICVGIFIAYPVMRSVRYRAGSCRYAVHHRYHRSC